MKFAYLFFAFFLTAFALNAQDITGVWRGTFYSGSGFYRQQYKYEVQIDELPNKGLKGVTYSYRTTVFYGKAALQGIFMDKNKSVVIKETQMLEMKISDQSVPCLMTCYLDYYKTGNTEVLEGTFTSINANNGNDCGPGNVYLEKVTESDFKKEDFLINHKPVTTPKPNTTQNNNQVIQTPSKPEPSASIKRLQSALGINADGIAGPNTNSVLKLKVPAFKGTITPKNADSLATVVTKLNTTTQKPVVVNKPKTNPPVAQTKPVQPPQNNKITDTIIKTSPDKPLTTIQTPKELPNKNIPVPDVIKQRENPLVKTIITTSPDIKIQLYDNGEIDGDTITVYHNNEIIANRKGLTATPITLNVKADALNNYHEFIMVANNLGSIPPNTALMVITTGGKRYELFISSDEKRNAKVVIQYQIPSTNGR